MIVETIVSTMNGDGSTNLAPMGPHFTGDWDRFELRPFSTSTTFVNLKRTREGILHLTDDVELIARAAIGQLNELPELLPGKVVNVQAVANACRWYEFQVDSITELAPRISVLCRTLHAHRERDFMGFNRAKHAVLECAIVATRIDFLPSEEIRDQFRRAEILVDKTGGDQERAAYQLLERFVSDQMSDRPADPT